MKKFVAVASLALLGLTALAYVCGIGFILGFEFKRGGRR